MRTCCVLLACLLPSLGLAVAPASAFTWPQDGVNLGWPASSPNDVCVAPDGEGGAIAAWYGWTGWGYNIVAQRVSGHGQIMWGTAGVVVSPYPANQFTPRILSDGAGGAVIAWMDERNGDLDIYSQRLDASGNRVWSADVPVVVAAGNQLQHAVVSDGAGGVIVAWEDNRGADNDVYAQRITAGGSQAWTPGGVAVCTATGWTGGVAIASDALGGAVIAWEDYRAGPLSGDVYAQRVYYNGALMWTANGVAICTATNIQRMVSIVEDGASGAILAWNDGRSGLDFYGQRIAASGAVGWTADGVLLQATIGTTSPPQLARDAAGGAYLVWEQGLPGDSDVRAQRVSGSGTTYWAAAGVPICALPAQAREPRVVADGVGGAIVAWYDYRANYTDIFAQRIDASGSVSWTADGAALCTANAHQYYPALATDGAGGALVAWLDGRDQVPRMVAQRVDRNGYWGYPSPDIRAVRDVPGDQGGLATVSWYASRLDPWPEMEIDHYTIWRAVPPELAKANLAGAKARVVDADAAPVETGKAAAEAGFPLYRLETQAGRTFFWELVATRDAYYLSAYAATVPTLYDSTDASPATQYFQVIAHGAYPSRFWASAVDSGVSVDNLAPAEPLELAGKRAYSPAGLALTWAPNAESDLARYALYRGADPSFVPGPGNLVATTTDTCLFDAAWPPEGAWYKLTALDVHGNESPPALLSPDQLTPVADGGPGLVTRLEGNVPNPFNPATRIVFTLRVHSEVDLRIHDAAGRLVRVLPGGPHEPGRHEVLWDGKDTAGRDAASGVYYCRLTTVDHRQTKKLTLVR